MSDDTGPDLDPAGLGLGLAVSLCSALTSIVSHSLNSSESWEEGVKEEAANADDGDAKEVKESEKAAAEKDKPDYFLPTTCYVCRWSDVVAATDAKDDPTEEAMVKKSQLVRAFKYMFQVGKSHSWH